MESNEVWKMCQAIMIGMEEKDLKDAFGTDDVSVIMDMGFGTASKKFLKWQENADHYQRPLTRGDVVICSGVYYMIIGYWGDMEHMIEAMGPDGRIESLTKDDCKYDDMHLSIHDIPLGHIQDFLMNLQDLRDRREVEFVKDAERLKHVK